MSRKLRVCCICGIVALALFVPGLMLGQEIPGAVQTGMNVPSLAPDANMSQDEKPMTLEEIKKMFGPHNVCGMECGWPLNPHCTISCGDAARCVNHWCVWI